MTMAQGTHEMNCAQEPAARACFIDQRGTAKQDAPRQMFTNPTKIRTRQFLASILH
jgi:ABC-type polar amino acid transport system ATPase subunit